MRVNLLRRAKSGAKLLRLLNSPGAEPTIHLCELLGSVYFAGIPSIDLTSLMSYLRNCADDPIDRVVVHPLLRGTGSGSAAEMAALSVLVAAKRPKSILEFGTYDGCSTWHLWANSSRTTRIVTLDLPPNVKVADSTDESLQGVRERPFLPKDPRVELVEVDSRFWEPDVTGGVDFCFIDAGHTYSCVKNDTEKAMRLMNRNGLTVWHDATWTRDSYGVNKYLKEMRGKGHDVRLLTIGPFDYSGIAILLT